MGMFAMPMRMASANEYHERCVLIVSSFCQPHDQRLERTAGFTFPVALTAGKL